MKRRFRFKVNQFRPNKKERLNILGEQIKKLFTVHKEIVMLDLPKLFFSQFHRRLDPSLYRQVSIRSLMDELRNGVSP